MSSAQAAAPVAPAIVPQQLTEGRSGSITVPAFSDPDGDALTYTYSGLPAWLSVYNPSANPRYLLGTPPYTESGPNSSKTYWITVTATDPAGERASRAFSLTILNANAPPTRPESIPPQTASEGSFFNYTVPVFPDPDGDAVSYSYSGLPSWLTVYNPQANPRYLYGRPPYSESGLNTTRQYWITVTATDSHGSSSSRAFSLTVLNVNAVPQAPVIADLAFHEGALIQYSVPKFTDVDGDVLAYAIEGLPSWLTVYNPTKNPRYLYGRVPLGDAAPNASRDYPIRVTATDPSSASASATFTLRVVPAIFIAPSSLSFDAQLAGTASAAQTVTVTNSGLATLGITGIALTGTDAAAFGQTTDCGSSLAVGSSCTVSVTFAPTAAGDKAASLSIATDAAGSPALVALSGAGIAPALSVAPASVSFGDQLINTTSVAQGVTLTNSGTAPLSISGIALTGTDNALFGQTTDCGPGLTVGSSCTVGVTFTPTAAGDKAASLSIATDAAGSPALVALSGAGIAPALSVAPASVSFGEQLISTTSVAQGVTLTNSGTALLSISGIALTGTDSALFGQSTDCGPGLAVGSSCTVSVTFAPTAAGDKAASLSIATDAAGSPALVALTGSGIAPALTVDPASLSFDARLVGTTSATQAVTLTNSGTASLAIGAITLTGTDSTAFGQVTDCDSSLAVGASCTVSLTFTPTTAGAKSAALSITTDAAGSPALVALSGDGFELGSEDQPARSARQILALHPTASSGMYWFDPDGPGVNAPFKAYADMTTAHGGWMQVRRVPGVGDWYPIDDDLVGNVAYNPSQSGHYAAPIAWSLKFDYFVNGVTEVLFKTGDGVAWCVLRRGTNFNGTTGSDTRQTTVWASAGVGVSAPGATNVLFRPENQEDPWIGCEGTHTQNTVRMLYGEDSHSAHTDFKNEHAGVDIFVRALQDYPTLAISPSVVAFGNLPVDSPLATKTIAIGNAGSGDVNISGISISGSDADSFSLTHDCPTPLVQGGTCTVRVTFSTRALGAKTAQININAGPVFIVPLSGRLVDLGLGASAARPAASAADLLLANPAASDGAYWFDPDGEGPNLPFQTFADMTTSGGRWMQVRRVPVDVAWYPRDDDLRGTASLNASYSTVPLSPISWGLRFDYFVDANTEYLFKSGDSLSWCVLRRGANNFDGTTNVFGRATRVWSSLGVTQRTGWNTNVLMGTGSTAEPWIGCEGSHGENQARMLYGEGTSSSYVTYKNAHQGIDIFVRPAANGAGLTVSTTSLSYEAQAPGVAHPPRTVKLTSRGVSAITISSVSLTGTDAASFSLINNCPTSLAVGASCTLDVTFDPATNGTKTATLSIATNDPSSPARIALSGRHVGPDLGTEASPALSVSDLWVVHPSVASGVYWFDPDGSGSNAAFPAYVDMTTAGGGWMQVRRIPGSGGWYPQNDDLSGASDYNRSYSGVHDANMSWGVRFDYFVDSGTEYMFAAGDRSAHCVMRRGTNMFAASGGGGSLLTRVIASGGVGIAAGGYTNVLFRAGYDEDPWIGCEGTHDQNMGRMLYGESSSAAHVAFKNGHQGIDVLVRPASTNPLSVSPASVPFGDQVAGSASAEVLVTLRNNGPQDVEISGVNLAGDGAPSFALGNQCPATLGAWASCTIGVTFAPSAVGARSATLTIAATSNTGTWGATVALWGNVPAVGDSADQPARSVWEILESNPSAASGIYWFDLDGSGPALAFQAYADMTTAGGGWLQVRRVPGTGNWYPKTDDLRGWSNYNSWYSSVKNSDIAWSLPFGPIVDADTEYLFKAGDGSAWCVMKRGTGDFASTTDPSVLATPVLASYGVAVAQGGYTNVLMNYLGLWIGCQGSHTQNQALMLYGEGGQTGYVSYKNLHQGIGVYVRNPVDAQMMPSISLSTTSVAFGNQLVGAAYPAQIVHVTNTGRASLDIGSIQSTGADAADFTQVNSCSVTLQPGEACFISLRFLPVIVGSKVAALAIGSTAPGSPTMVTLTGTGVATVGESVDRPALSAQHIRDGNPAASSGMYWLDPDGQGGHAAFETYVDMGTAGGGWTQVRRIPGAGSWYPQNDDLAGWNGVNSGYSSTYNSDQHWSLEFDYFADSTTEFLFATGDGSAYCVMIRGGGVFDGTDDTAALATRVIASSGVGIEAGGYTNVVYRPEHAPDPWIGCEGSHDQNTARMLYGEAATDQYVEFKNGHQGINVFVRQPVSEDTAASQPQFERAVQTSSDANESLTTVPTGTTSSTTASPIERTHRARMTVPSVPRATSGRLVPSVTGGEQTRAMTTGPASPMRPIERHLCDVVADGAERLSVWRLPYAFASGGLHWFVAEHRVGTAKSPAQALGAGVEYDLAGRLYRPAGAIARCGSAVYAWRDGYAPEIWSLSRTLAPIWNKAILPPSEALRVIGTACDSDEGLLVTGVTGSVDSRGSHGHGLDEVTIRVPPYPDEISIVESRAAWVNGPPPPTDRCRMVERANSRAVSGR